MNKETKNIDLLSDQSISSIEEDKFERFEFVDSIAEIIHSQSTLVNPQNIKDFKNIEENMIIGLYGSWGVGKSSVLNLLEENLKSRQLEAVFFNPWMYSNESQLIISLFDIIVDHSGLKDDTKKELISLLAKYQPLISLASSSAGKIASVVTSTFGEDSKRLNAFYCKKKIDEILAGKANPIVVFIDDVDRLSKNEIHVLFKTLRLIANFKNVIYVIAFDFDMVSKSIKENYVDGKIEDGRSFIEKIIQIPIRIPEIKPDKLMEYGINYIKQTTEIDLDKNRIFKTLFEAFFYTPRDVKRFINGFRFTQNYLKDCIETVDLILLELIRVKVHGLYEIIKIYYLAIKAINPGEYYVARVVEYLRRQKPEFFNQDGQLDRKSNREFSIYTNVFNIMFGTDIISLSFRHGKARGLQLKAYMDDPDVSKLTNLRNPKVLVNYFEKIPKENILDQT